MRSWLFVAMVTSGIGCSSNYVPKRNYVAALTIEKGQLAVVKDRSVHAIMETGVAPRELTRCDSQARTYIADATSLLLDGRLFTTIGSVLTVLVAPVGLPFSVLGAIRTAEGQATLVDAVNRHNDAPACADPNGIGADLVQP